MFVKNTVDGVKKNLYDKYRIVICPNLTLILI